MQPDLYKDPLRMLAFKSGSLYKSGYTSATAHEKSRRLFEGEGANVCTNCIVLKYERGRAKKAAGFLRVRTSSSARGNVLNKIFSGGDANRGNTRTHPEHDG